MQTPIKLEHRHSYIHINILSKGVTETILAKTKKYYKILAC